MGREVKGRKYRPFPWKSPNKGGGGVTSGYIGTNYTVVRI
jgi:hypothetical protein